MRSVRVKRSTAVLDEELGGTPGCNLHQRRIDPALATLAGLGHELVAARGARLSRRVEMRSLNHDVDGRGVDLGFASAHDARERDGTCAVPAGRVRHHEVLGVKRAGLVVESSEHLALLSAAHHDRFRKLRGIEHVQRLAEIEHDVVADVDDERDRAHASERKTLLHPTRARSRGVHAVHALGDIGGRADVAADRGVIFEEDLNALTACLGHLDLKGGVGEARPGRVGVLACNASHRETVAAIGRHVDLNDFLIEAKKGDRVIARLRFDTVGDPAAENDDAVLAILAEAQLAGRADHAVGNVTIGLACRNLEVPGKNGSGK